MNAFLYISKYSTDSNLKLLETEVVSSTRNVYFVVSYILKITFKKRRAKKLEFFNFRGCYIDN